MPPAIHSRNIPGLKRKRDLALQWNPSIADTIGTNNFVLYEEMFLIQGLPVGLILGNRAVEYNMATFSELSLAVRWQGQGKQRLIL